MTHDDGSKFLEEYEKMRGKGHNMLTKQGKSRQGVAVGKGVSGTGFEITFKFDRLRFIWESQINYQFPWLIFGGVCWASLVVGFNSSFDVWCESNISLIGKWYTLNEIYVLHRFNITIEVKICPMKRKPPFACRLRRATFAIHFSKFFFGNGLPTVAQEASKGLRRAKVGGGGGSRIYLFRNL